MMATIKNWVTTSLDWYLVNSTILQRFHGPFYINKNSTINQQHSRLYQKLEQVADHDQTYLQPPLRQWVFWQLFPFSWTTLRGKDCRHPIAVMEVVDTFGQYLIWIGQVDLVLTCIHLPICFGDGCLLKKVADEKYYSDVWFECWSWMSNIGYCYLF